MTLELWLHSGEPAPEVTKKRWLLSWDKRVHLARPVHSQVGDQADLRSERIVSVEDGCPVAAFANFHTL